LAYFLFVPPTRKLTDHRALVTGASSGIGREMARQLAALGSDLVIAARRTDRLEELAAELREAHAVTVEPVASDLAEADAAGRLWDAARAGGRVDICINNAGFGLFDPFTALSRDRNLEMIAVNVRSVVDLSHRFVDHALGSDRRGYLLNIGSTAAFQPVPNMATYGATKHFVLAFSEALAHELKKTNVSVTCLNPGGTWTEFFDVSQQKIEGALAKASMLGPDRVAAIGLKAMLKGRRSVVSGGLNKLAAWMTRFAPRSTATAVAGSMIGTPPAKRGNGE
jgi:short-subunit dehydrogenase